MQPPVTVPWKGAPLTFEDVTRPEGAKVTLTCAPPEGSSACLQPEARPAAAASDDDAAERFWSQESQHAGAPHPRG